MIDHILEFSLRQRTLVMLACVLLIAVGSWSFLHLPMDAVPDITNVQVQINTEVEALAPEEVEKMVTFPIETEMGGIQGLMELRSLSKSGLSQVTLVFRDGTDVYRARQLVSERLQSVMDDLPTGLQPKLAPISTGLGEIYYYSVDYAPEAPHKPTNRLDQLLQLKLIQDWTIKPMLRTVPGVTEVNSSGGYEKQFQVLADPQKLKSVGLSFGELAEIIEENTQNAGGGVFQQGGEQIAVRSVGKVATPEEIREIPIRFRATQQPLLVGDVAQVEIGGAPRMGASTKNGHETVVGAALMLAGENSRTVSRAVGRKLEEIQKKLPEGVRITTEYDRSELVEKTIRTIQKNLFEGGIFVVAVLLALLGNWRAALIVATAIPLSMLFAFTGMVGMGVSGNLMSLGAIDFGLIVDGAVVIAESAVRRLGERQHQWKRRLTFEERLDVVLSASREVGRPMVFAVAIITIVYFPILALTGIEGKMFKPMALTVMMALIGALILALTVIPVLCALLLSGRMKEQENAMMRWFRSMYSPVLEACMRRMKWVLGGAVALFMLALLSFSKMGAEFVPQLDEGAYAAHLIRTTSIGLDSSIRMQEKSERALLEKFPELKSIFSRIGTAEVATDPMGVNVADTYIFLKPEREWPKINGKRRSKEMLVEAMKEELEVKVPGQAVLFSQPIEMRFNEILEGTRADIAVKIFGNDYQELERIATEAREVLEKIRGAADVEFDALGKAPILEVTLDRDATKRYGSHASEINDLISVAMGGRSVGFVAEGNQRTTILVRLPESWRGKMEEIRRLPVRTHDGGLVSLGQVAQIRIREQVNAISRELGQRRVAIMVNLRGRDVESFVKEAEAKIVAEVSMPPGYYIEWGGQFQNLKEARQRLMLVVPAALTLIFFLILGAFQSARQALMVCSGIPLALTGGIFALALRGIPFSISAGIGFIALSGVAVLNGVVLVSCFNQLRAQGRTLNDAVREGSLIRLRPVLMTALVASLGFIPMAFASGAGAEVQRPLATVVIGGILSSTFLTLLLLPPLYRWVETDAKEFKS